MFTWDPEVCMERMCVMGSGITHMERMEVLKKISGVIVKKSKGDLLSPLSFENLCVDCTRPFISAHHNCRR